MASSLDSGRRRPGDRWLGATAPGPALTPGAARGAGARSLPPRTLVLRPGERQRFLDDLLLADILGVQRGSHQTITFAGHTVPEGWDCANCLAVTGDCTRAEVRWRGRQRSERSRQRIRLRFHLRDAHPHSFRLQ